jgi:hypothetical protein
MIAFLVMSENQWFSFTAKGLYKFTCHTESGKKTIAENS